MRRSGVAGAMGGDDQLGERSRRGGSRKPARHFRYGGRANTLCGELIGAGWRRGGRQRKGRRRFGWFAWADEERSHAIVRSASPLPDKIFPILCCASAAGNVEWRQKQEIASYSMALKCPFSINGIVLPLWRRAVTEICGEPIIRSQCAGATLMPDDCSWSRSIESPSGSEFGNPAPRAMWQAAFSSNRILEKMNGFCEIGEEASTKATSPNRARRLSVAKKLSSAFLPALALQSMIRPAEKRKTTSRAIASKITAGRVRDTEPSARLQSGATNISSVGRLGRNQSPPLSVAKPPCQIEPGMSPMVKSVPGPVKRSESICIALSRSARRLSVSPSVFQISSGSCWLRRKKCLISLHRFVWLSFASFPKTFLPQPTVG